MSYIRILPPKEYALIPKLLFPKACLTSPAEQAEIEWKLLGYGINSMSAFIEVCGPDGADFIRTQHVLNGFRRNVW